MACEVRVSQEAIKAATTMRALINERLAQAIADLNGEGRTLSQGTNFSGPWAGSFVPDGLRPILAFRGLIPLSRSFGGEPRRSLSGSLKLGVASRDSTRRLDLGSLVEAHLVPAVRRWARGLACSGAVYDAALQRSVHGTGVVL